MTGFDIISRRPAAVPTFQTLNYSTFHVTEVSTSFANKGFPCPCLILMRCCQSSNADP